MLDAQNSGFLVLDQSRLVHRARYSNRPPYPGERIASIDESLNVHELPNLAIQNGGDPVEPEFELRYDPEPSGITIDPNAKPWFAEESGDSGWRLGTAPAGGVTGPYTEYELESCPSLDGRARARRRPCRTRPKHH